jgi:heme/copper-type cytochrome/quinol oxidase subunit 3
MSDLALQRERAGSKPAGWWGMLILVATEATLFGAIFGTYYYLRFKAVEWPPPGVDPPELAVPLVLALVLAATTVPMAIASRSAAAGRLPATRLAVLGAFVVQAGFFAMAQQQFQDDIAAFTPEKIAYGSITITMLGAHQAHVAVGLLLDVWLLLKLARGLTRYRVVAVRSIALYWYFVNLLALLVVGAELSARL